MIFIHMFDGALKERTQYLESKGNRKWSTT